MCFDILNVEITVGYWQLPVYKHSISKALPNTTGKAWLYLICTS